VDAATGWLTRENARRRRSQPMHCGVLSGLTTNLFRVRVYLLNARAVRRPGTRRGLSRNGRPQARRRRARETRLP
jgi:hypothetical protein